MAGWIILGILVLLIAVIMLIPLGADISFIDKKFSLSALVGSLQLQLLPKEEKSEEEKLKEKEKKKKREEKKAAKALKKQKKSEKKKKDKPEKEEPEKKTKLDFTLDEIIALLKKVVRGFGKFNRTINVRKFLFHYVAGGEEPYKAAVTLGKINACLSALTPLCSEKFADTDASVWTDSDFTLDKPLIDFETAFTIRLGGLIRMINTIAFGALFILIKHKVKGLANKIFAKNDNK